MSNRKTLKVLFWNAFVAVLLPSAVFADVIKCVLDPGQHEEYIATEIRIELGAMGRATVSDAIIASTGSEVARAEVVKNTASRLSLRWDVTGVKNDPSEVKYRDAHLVVRLTIQKADGSAILNALDAQDWRNATYRATGKCTGLD
jgi:hypothetical protein